jgi:hypothetical protein
MSGKGKRGLLVVFNEEETLTAEKETLEKMIAAIKYQSAEDVYMASLEMGKDYSLSASGVTYQDILLFGVQPARIGLQVEAVQDKIVYFESSRMLLCPSLREINAVLSKKQTLWQLLQAMFLTS